MKKFLFTVFSLALVLFSFCVFTPHAVYAEKVIQDTITFVQGADITSLDPHVGKQLRAIVVTTNIFDTLVEFDANRDIVPALAEKWEYVNDTQIKLSVKKGVKFHNGEPLTAADVKFSLERAMGNPNVSNYVNFIKDVEQVDDYTVLVNTKDTYAPSMSVFTTNLVAVVPKAYIEKVGDEQFAKNPIGTGRYKFVEWKQGEYCKLTAFEDCHWGAPKTKNLVMKVVPENAQRTVMLETGEVDIAYEVLPNDVSKIEGNSKLKAVSISSSKCIYMAIDMTQKGPLSNKLVRQAIEFAIDKPLLVDTVLYNKGSVANIPVAPAEFGYSDNFIVREFNLEKARELMKEAGFEKGFEMKLWTDNDQAKMEYCQIIQSMLQEINIKVNIEMMEYATLSSRVKKEPYEAALLFFNPLTGDGGHTLYTLFFSKSTTNNTRFKDDKLDEILNKELYTLDKSQRQAMFEEVYKIIREEMPMIPLYYEGINVGLNSGVENFVLKPTGMHKYVDTVRYK